MQAEHSCDHHSVVHCSSVFVEVPNFNTIHSSTFPLMSKRRPIDSISTRVSQRRRHQYLWMDIAMAEARSVGTQTGKRQRTDAEEGAEEAGSGLEVTKPFRLASLIWV